MPADPFLRPVVLLAGERLMRRPVSLPHGAPYTVLRYVTEGAGEFAVGEERRAVGPGDLVCYRPRQGWHLTPAPGPTVRYFWVHLELLAPAPAPAWRQETSNSPLELQPSEFRWERVEVALPSFHHPSQRAEFEGLVRRLVAAYQRGQAGAAACSALCLQLLAHLAEECCPPETPVVPPAPPLRTALAYLEQHYARRVGLAELGEVACLHPVYLGALFKKETGHSPLQYLNRLRVEAAERLLREEPGRTVESVARQVGFRSARQFNRAFKRYAGRTPSEARRS